MPDEWDEETGTTDLEAVRRAGDKERRACLTILTGSAAGQLFKCGKSTIVMGRSPQADLKLDDDGISRNHARLRCETGRSWVSDLASRNGTFVNGERTSGRQRLRDADRVRVGRTVLAYNAAQSSLAEQTTPAGERLALPELTNTQHRVLVALCRPYRDGPSFATPASNQTIAAEVFLSVDAVKMHLRTMFARFELSELPQNQKRARLAELALQLGVISQRDLA